MTLELLLLRSAIADKEWAIACANMDTAAYGKWSCDWNKMAGDAQMEIDHIVAQIRKYGQTETP